MYKYEEELALKTPIKYISVTDFAILLYNVFKGSQFYSIGFEDAQHTLDSYIKRFYFHQVKLKVSDIESALWSCNLLDEKNEFWHPRKKTFKSFCNEILNDSEFDLRYNYIKDKEK